MMPIYEGRTLQEEEFNKLDDSIKSQFEEKSSIVQEQIMSTISEIKLIEKESEKKIQEWQSNISLLTVNVHINYIKSKYKRNKKISQFMDNIKKDIIKNVPLFLEQPAQPTPPQGIVQRTSSRTS